MSVAGTVITVGVLYVAFRAAIRPKKPDPMAGRLVPRPYALDLEAMKAEGTRQQRERDEFNQKVWEARLRSDARNAEMYKYDCAKRAWHAGYGPRPDLPASCGDMLAAYRPRARHEEL